MDDDVYVIVLRGAGDKFFSAGANIKMLSEVTPGFKYYFCLHANETLNRLEQTPKLVIAALNGHTVGGGLEIAMAADIRIATQGAGKVGLPEVSLGVLPGTGGTQRLSRIVGKSKSIELMVEGGLFEFEEAPRARHRQLCLARRRERQEVVGPRHRVRAELLPAEQGLEGGRPHQALRPERLGNPVRVGPGHRARAAAAALPERGRQGRSRRLQPEAQGGLHRKVALLGARDGIKQSLFKVRFRNDERNQSGLAANRWDDRYGCFHRCQSRSPRMHKLWIRGDVHQRPGNAGENRAEVSRRLGCIVAGAEAE